MNKILILLIAFLVSCTSIPASVLQDRQGLADSLGVAADSIEFSDSVVFAVTERSARFAPFTLGVFALTDQTIYLLSYKDGILSLDEEVRIEDIEYAGFGTTGAFNHLQQVRIEFGRTKAIALNFANTSDAGAGYKEQTQRAVVVMTKAGLNLKPGAVWVHTGAAKNWQTVVPSLVQ